MNVEYRFLTLQELENLLSYSEVDSENILNSGLELYKTAIVKHPYRKYNDYIICLAIVEGKIVGRYILFRTKLKVGKQVIDVQTGGGILVSEKYRGLGIGKALINSVLQNDIYWGALYTRAAYNIVKITETMLEIPQYVKSLRRGIKSILDIHIHIKSWLLKRRIVIEKLSVVPNWVNNMIMVEGHKYMEVHDASWLQWALNNTATGNTNDYQSFFAVYDKKMHPIGFYMTKTRTIEQSGLYYTKSNLVEWASISENIKEFDINILALNTLDSSVEKFWTISYDKITGKKLQRYSFQRKGWFAMSVRNNEHYNDIGNPDKWRIRYGAGNTTLV